MKLRNPRVRIFVLMGILFLSTSFAYAETAEECLSYGIAYHQQDNLPQAISYYTKAIEINPDYAAAYSNRGLAYHQQGNLPQAISDYTKAIEINPNYAEAYSNRGASHA